MGHNYNGRKLAVYTSDLEKYIIENAGAYYQRKSREWMDNDSMPIYLEKVGRQADQRAALRHSAAQLIVQPLTRCFCLCAALVLVVLCAQVEKVLAAETARVSAYLNRNTQEPLAKECYVQLLKTHQKELLRKKTGLFHLLSINATEDLSRLYRLYKNYESDLEPIAEMFEEFITKSAEHILHTNMHLFTRAPCALA